MKIELELTADYGVKLSAEIPRRGPDGTLMTEGRGLTIEADPEQLRKALDSLIRSDKAAWEIVRSVAGHYQAELVSNHLEKQHILQGNVFKTTAPAPGRGRKQKS